MAIIARDEPRARKSPEATFRALAEEIEELHEKLADALDRLIEKDMRDCPGIPGRVLRGLRTARFCYGYCPCAWARDEAASTASTR
jgi:hypothetical protein